MILETTSKRSSSPSIIVVSAKPRSPLQRGHFFCSPFSPRYHSSTQLWQPKILLQQRTKIGGGLIGLALQMLHRRLSKRTLDTPKGRGRLGLTSKIFDSFSSITSTKLESSLGNLCPSSSEES